LAIWDALSAFIIHKTAPWPSFFMIQTIGSGMFFAAALMHAVCLYLVCRLGTRRSFLGLEQALIESEPWRVRAAESASKPSFEPRVRGQIETRFLFGHESGE
jgi:hypothetical protein